MADYPQGGTFHTSIEGTNTLTQVTKDPTILYSLSVAQFGGSMGYLQVYNNGTQQAVAGEPSFIVPLSTGTFTGTPSTRDISFGPFGRQMDGGLSYLWAAGGTGTVAHGVNAMVDISFKGTRTI